MPQQFDQQEQLKQSQQQYDRLNAEQKAAVDAIEGPVMTIAGAGTGKTQILAVRIAKILLDTQIDPYNILCLTFTEAGVTAMRKRLLEIIGSTAYHVKISTFHGFCNEIIREDSEIFGLTGEFEQIDDLEKVLLIHEIIDQLGVKSPIRPHGEPYHYQYDLENRIKDLKKENITPEKFSQTLQELEKFTLDLEPLLHDFCATKGRPTEADISNADAEEIIAHFQNLTPIQQAHLNYFQQLWQKYQENLTGAKSVDGQQRTAFRNSTRAFLEKLSKDLAKQQELAKSYHLYQQKMAERKRYDYEDMILLVSQQFSAENKANLPGLLRKYQERYQYILVDEYQDTNTAQNKTVELLGSFFESPNIFVVGDDDQSIYRFQGASVENIIEFHKRYQPELKIITLIKNYRSQQGILDAAGAVISHNQTRLASQIPGIDKTLHSQVEAPAAPLELTIYETEDAENYGIAKQIQSLITTGTKPDQIAVLYRKHDQSTDLIEIFQKLTIPKQIIAGIDILKDLKIDQLVKLFKLINKPNDNDLLAEVLFHDYFHFHRLDILKLSHYYYQNRLEKSGQSLFLFISNPKSLILARLENPDQFTNFAKQLTDWKDLSINQTLSLFFEKVTKDSGYLQHLVDQNTRLEGFNRLNTLFKEIKKQNHRNHALTITEFLEQLKTRSENRLKLLENPLVGERHGVQLMTAHGSKGLEFEHVFCIRTTSRSWDKNAMPDKIPLPRGLVTGEIHDGNQEEAEDNRRLFYVALTRAKKMAHLSYARFRSEQNKVREDLPSIFLKEIPENLIHTTEQAGRSDQDLTELETLFLSEPEENFTENENHFLKGLIENVIYSPTSLNNYLTCPKKFFYQNLIRIPQAKNKSAAMGTAIHYALDRFFRDYKNKKILPPREFLTLHYKSALEKELLTDKDYRERLEIGQNILGDYYDAFNQSFSSDTTTEFNFSSDGVNIDGIPITGKIDKIVPTEEGITVTDFKTGNADRGMSKISHGGDYWRQLVFYKLLCDRSPKFRRDFQNRPMSTTQIEFLEKSKFKKTFLHPTIKISPDDEKEVIENIRFVHDQVTDLHFEKIAFSDPCETCPFKGICWKNK